MKRKLTLLIMLLLTTIIVSGCDITGIIPPISENLELTPEEIELIREYGYDSKYTIRWPDGYVDVYDTTGFGQMQEVLNQWNAVIGGPVVFRLSSNPNSQVKVYYKSIFGGCGNWDIKWNEDYTLSTIDVQISNNAFFCGYPSSKYSLYLFMFKGVAGFKGWTTKGFVPYEEWTNFTTINNTMKKMVKALYKVPPGYPLQEIEFELSDDTLYTCCSGCCLDLGVSEFHQFNVIDYHDKSKVTLKPKVGNLPKNIRITLEGVKFDIEKPFNFSGPIDYCTTKSVTGDWSASSSIIAEATFINGVLTNKKYESINGYVIETDFLSSQIYVKLSKEDKDDRSYAFKAVPWKGIEMKVYDLSGKEIGSYSFDKGIFPKVESNFGQCVWWAIRQKWETDGEIITPPFYLPTWCKTIDETYSPESKDVLIAYYDDREHYAFIEEIEGETVTISQFNYPKQERKSVQKLCRKDNKWYAILNSGDCQYWFQFNYYIRQCS